METLLPVNEVFDTIQGEATNTGLPASFLRLQGCAVGCPWCDTKYTWVADPARRIGPAEMLAKTQDTPGFAAMTTDEIVAMLDPRPPRLVVITGGEPCAYDLEDLTGRLLRHRPDRRVQIETSGTQPIRVDPAAWVTVSPKPGMPGGFAVLPSAVSRANEIKWPVGAPRDVDALRAFLGEHRLDPSVPVWLQPLSRSPKATELCIEAATMHGWRVSIQVHALLGVR